MLRIYLDNKNCQYDIRFLELFSGEILLGLKAPFWLKKMVSDSGYELWESAEKSYGAFRLCCTFLRGNVFEEK